jgi:hypothetical protein
MLFGKGVSLLRHAAVLWPLGANDLPRVVTMRVLQQNLQPLMIAHEVQGGYLVDGSPLHLAAGRMIDRMLRSLGAQPDGQGEAREGGRTPV